MISAVWVYDPSSLNLWSQQSEFWFVSVVVVDVILPIGHNSAGLHGEVVVQRSVWLDGPAHQPRSAQQTRHGGIHPCKSHAVVDKWMISFTSTLCLYSVIWCDILWSILVFVHRYPGYLWIRGLPDKQLWAVLHQLRQWETALLLQPAHLQSGAGERIYKPFDLISFIQVLTFFK